MNNTKKCDRCGVVEDRGMELIFIEKNKYLCLSCFIKKCLKKMNNEREVPKVEKGEKRMIIVSVKHVNYNGTFRPDKYYFKSNDNLKPNDYVSLDTKYGCVKGIVCDVYEKFEDLLTIKGSMNFRELKDCCKY